MYTTLRENMDPSSLVQEHRKPRKRGLEKTANMRRDVRSKSRMDEAMGKVPRERLAGETNVGGPKGMTHVFWGENGGRE